MLSAERKSIGLIGNEREMSMTENESKFGNVAIVGGGRGSGKTMKIQLDLLKELEAYRALGTVEDIEKSMQNVSVLLAEHEVLKLYQSLGTVEEIQKAMESLPLLQVEHKLLQEYQNIGTVRLCRIAVERMKPKKPIDKLMYLECPSCGDVGIEDCGYCSACGQKLDWE